MHLGLEPYAPFLIYFGAIVVFFLSVFWKPQIGLYYLVPLLPMQTARYWLHALPVGKNLVDILLLGILIGLFFHRERPIVVPSPLNKMLLLFMGLTYLSLWQGAFFLGGALPISLDDPRFSDWKNYVEMMFIFFVAAATIRKPKQMIIMISLMCLSVLVVNRTYHNKVGGRDFSQFSYSLRDAGALGYAGENGMGAFQSEFAVFLIGLASFAKKRIVKVGLWAVAFTSIYSLVVTFSRGGYLGFLIGLLVLGLIKERKLLILLVVIFATWQSIVPHAVVERVLMTYQAGEGLDPSVGTRVSLWEDALQIIDHNPVIGTGFDTYKFMGRIGYSDTHNYYVKVLLELGFVGLLIFLYLLRVVGKMSWRLFRSARDPFLSALGCALFCMFMCAMAVNFFGDRWSFLQVNGFFWVLLGLVARGLLLVEQEQQAPEMEAEELAVASSSAPDVSHA